MDPSAGLPAYWTERTNAMSERDMALGGVAARSFSARGAYGDGDEAHKTSEQVGEYWMKRIESERAEAADGAGGDATGMSSIDWERRARATLPIDRRHPSRVTSRPIRGLRALALDSFHPILAHLLGRLVRLVPVPVRPSRAERPRGDAAERHVALAHRVRALGPIRR